jgi:hypothetical protein
MLRIEEEPLHSLSMDEILRSYSSRWQKMYACQEALSSIESV